MEEGKKINLSLSCLGKNSQHNLYNVINVLIGNVIHALTTNCEHIPYRDSKLTRILQESVGGNFKTSLIVTCSPHSSNREETLSSLKFASRAKCIKNHFKMNIHNSPEAMIAIIDHLRIELEGCKGEIAKYKSDIFEKNRLNLQMNPTIYENTNISPLNISSTTHLSQNLKRNNNNLSKFRTLDNRSKVDVLDDNNDDNMLANDGPKIHSEPLSPSQVQISKDFENLNETKYLDSISNEFYGSLILEKNDKNNTNKYFVSNTSNVKVSGSSLKQSDINNEKSKIQKKNAIKASLVGSNVQTHTEILQTSTTNLKNEDVSINKVLSTNLQVCLDDSKKKKGLMKTVAEFGLCAENDQMRYEERSSNTSDPKSKREYHTYTYFKTNLELINQNEILEMRVKSLKGEVDNMKGMLVEKDTKILKQEEDNMKLRNSILQTENKYNKIMEDRYMTGLKLDTQKGDSEHSKLTIQVLEKEVNAFTEALASCEQSIHNLLKEKSRSSNSFFQ